MARGTLAPPGKYTRYNGFMSQIHRLKLPNGLSLVAEPMEGVQSLAITVLLPAGAAHEPADQLGVAAMLEEMLPRGAGNLDSRAFSDALDHLGVMRGSGVEATRMRLYATMIASKLPEALPLIADMILRPHLPENALEPARDLALQAIESLEDEPQQKVFYALRHQHHGEPYGRSPLGEASHLEKITLEQVRQFHKDTFVPDGTVIGVAGHFNWDELSALITRLFSDWQGKRHDPQPADQPARGYRHIEAATQQVHIGLAYDAVPESHADSVLQRAAVAVLSGGMSGRLFTEVREKRGLCYSVFASYNGMNNRSAVLSYAGTTPQRAQETLDVLAGELRRLKGNITAEEFDRAIVGMKSGLVMQGESTGARAAAIASDEYQLGRPRTLDELTQRIDELTVASLNDFTQRRLPGAMTLVTIGPSPLNADAAR